jgi:hypothetical protein
MVFRKEITDSKIAKLKQKIQDLALNESYNCCASASDVDRSSFRSTTSNLS